MKMEDLEGKVAYISKNSITMKDDDGKTRGIVRNVKTWSTLVTRELFDWSRKFREMGLSFSSEYIIVDNEPYYLYDLSKDDFYKKHCITHSDIFESDIKRYKERQEFVAKVKAAGVKVVNCYVKWAKSY